MSEMNEDQQFEQRPVGCVFFPFVSIRASEVERFLRCFDQITLYQPVGATTPAGLQPWVDKGVLAVRTPFEGITDGKELARRLDDWKGWVHSKSNEDLAYLNVMRDQIGPVHPITPELISRIKQPGMTADGETEGEGLSPELFLSLSRDLDDQSADVEAHLARFRHEHAALQTLFRAGQNEADEIPIIDPLLSETVRDRGAVLTEKRMVSWTHLFQKDPVLPAVLLTDSPAVFSWLFENHQESAGRTFSARTSCGKKVGTVMTQCLTRQWGSELETALSTLGGKTRDSNGRDMKDVPIDLRILPDVDPVRFLNDRCGIRTDETPQRSCPNTVVGLLSGL